MLGRPEYFLDDDEDGTRPFADGGRPTALKVVEITTRIVEAVHVIDAQPGHPSFLGQPERQSMDRLEDDPVFHADGGKIVDVEEAAVVDLVRGDAPRAQAVRLVDEHAEELFEAREVALFAPQVCERGVYRAPERSAPLVESRQTTLDDGQLVLAFAQSFGRYIRAGRQTVERADDALELEHVDVEIVDRSAKACQRRVQNADPRFGCERQLGAGIHEAEASRAIRDIELLRGDDATELVGQYGKKHAPGELRLGRAPIDVEKAGR